MPVRGNISAAFGDGVVNELVVRRRKAMETSLDDMIAVEVFDERDNVGAKSLHNEIDVRRRCEEFDHLLDCAGSMHIFRNRYEMGGHQADDCRALIFSAMLE